MELDTDGYRWSRTQMETYCSCSVGCRDCRRQGVKPRLQLRLAGLQRRHCGCHLLQSNVGSQLVVGGCHKKPPASLHVQPTFFTSN